MAGAAINMSLKSGTNTPHGQVYYFMQNPVLNANKYFRLAVGKPQFRLYRWGGNVSGPVYIPKIYDGRNKTFFMYGYEGIWSFDPSPWVVESVPDAAQRTGDFSACWRSGPATRSTIPTPSRRLARPVQPQPLPDNRIPVNQISPRRKHRQALGHAQSAGHNRRHEQLHQGQERSGHLLESHRPHRSERVREAALLRAHELHLAAAAREPAPEPHGWR